jgi:GDPmannose 4,6-dehydratase
MNSALITGITGQDGSYLAELLLAKGYRVIGTSRNIAKAVRLLPASLAGQVELVQWDMLDQRAISNVLSHYRPGEIYNFGAYSSGSGMFDEPVDIGEVNGLAVARMLEAIRTVDPEICFCQASSSEIFGAAADSPQSEETPIGPRSPYGAAKAYAHLMVQIYRKHHGLFTCSAILYNHESPRRGLEFVTRKVAQAAARIKRGQAAELHLGNLSSVRDWGFAGDYVRAMWSMLQQPDAADYVIATGQPHSVRDLCDYAFGHVSLDYRDYVREDAAIHRPVERVPLVGNPAKARMNLRWQPDVGFRELVGMMVDTELQLHEGELGANA